MEYTVIRAKGAYHSKPEIRGMALKDEYSLKVGNGEKPRVMSFEYCEWKAARLSGWAWGRGLKVPIWYENMKGTIAGLKVLIDLIDAIEWHCEVTGEECRALIDERLEIYEGLRVAVSIKGKEYEGIVSVEGKGIKYCFVRKEGKKGRYIKPYEIVGVRALM